MPPFKILYSLLGIAAGLVSAVPGYPAEPSVARTVNQVVERMRATLGEDELTRLDEQGIQRFITPADRQVLATQYWHFEANVPVVVSVMRDVGQNEQPFWLTDAGFRKTELKVVNEEYQYEVWEKRFDAGRVGLGINGFAKHRPHYFICVRPEHPGDRLALSRFFPTDQQVLEMRKGALIYHDWPELVLTEVPEPLQGARLLPTIRGRAREAQLVQGFRRTPSPSGAKPDQVVLTWSESPRTTQTIQWRTRLAGEGGAVRYRAAKGGAQAPWKETKAERRVISDRFLINDPAVSHYTATLRHLKPSTEYVYTVGGASPELRSEPADFCTAPEDSSRFTFLFLSDTHNSPVCGKLLSQALRQFPEAAFCTITGDLVSTGQYRDDWDQFFEATRSFADRRPLVPVLGNHDTLDGLGADLYLALFGLPNNGPRRLQPERCYSFQYANALFLVLDATASVVDQAPWLEAQLSRSKAKWKFALFHFPPYAPDDSNPEIVRGWCPLFDKYHVDFVLGGHVHHALRTYPMNHGKSVASPSLGTIYLLTVAVPNHPLRQAEPDYAAALDDSGLPVYQAFTIEGNRLVTRSCDLQGNIRDELVIEK